MRIDNHPQDYYGSGSGGQYMGDGHGASPDSYCGGGGGGGSYGEGTGNGGGMSGTHISLQYATQCAFELLIIASGQELT